MANPSFFTLLLAVAIAQFLASSAPGVNALQGMNLGSPPVYRRAEHAEINHRMLKKRRPQTGDDVPINPGADIPPASTTTSTPVAPTSTIPTTTTRPVSSAPPTSSTPNNVVTSTSLPNTSTTSSKSTTSTTPPAATTTPAQQTSATPAPTASHTTNKTGGIVYVTASAADASQTIDLSKDESASSLPHSVIIGLIVTGACIAAGAAIWTIVRKWKFSPSRHFEDRLEPINWEPKQASGIEHDPTAAALARGGSQNGTRPSSYMSGDEHGSVRNMSNTQHDAISMAPDFPPPHDFTAGPVGTGYVDMHRGPSPAPGQYGGAYGGQYETPNPYDAYDTGYGQQQRHY